MIRYRLAWDADLVSAVLAVFLRVVYGFYQRQASAEGYTGARCGSVTFVQRFGSALNVNPHFHVIVPDGVFVDGPSGDPEFVAAPLLTDKDVQHIAEKTATRVVRLLQRRGLLEGQHRFSLGRRTAPSIPYGSVPTGYRCDGRTSWTAHSPRLVDPQEGIQGGPLCFSSRGFSLHAATRIVVDDRSRLERLCRYGIRPPLAAGKLCVLDKETLSFSLKTPWSDGTTHLVLSPLELIEKLAALIPPPRLNLVRYHGVLAPNAASRDRIVPGPQEVLAEGCAHAEQSAAPRPVYRHSWARLLARFSASM